MTTARTLTRVLLLSSSFLGLAATGVQAATVLIANGSPADSSYGNAINLNNNVVNGGNATGTARGSSGLFDATNGNIATGSWLGGAGSEVQSTVPLYTVQYFYAGSESGDTIQVTTPTGTFTEGVAPLPPG